MVTSTEPTIDISKHIISIGPADNPTRIGIWYYIDLTEQDIDGKELIFGEHARIWSVGVSETTGKVYASLDSDLYMKPGYKCIWLR